MFLQLIDFLDGEAGCRCNLLNGEVHGLQVASGLLFVLSQLLHRRVSPRCRRVNPRHRRVALGQCRIALGQCRIALGQCRIALGQCRIALGQCRVTRTRRTLSFCDFPS